MKILKHYNVEQLKVSSYGSGNFQEIEVIFKHLCFLQNCRHKDKVKQNLYVIL